MHRQEEKIVWFYKTRTGRALVSLPLNDDSVSVRDSLSIRTSWSSSGRPGPVLAPPPSLTAVAASPLSWVRRYLRALQFYSSLMLHLTAQQSSSDGTIHRRGHRNTSGRGYPMNTVLAEATSRRTSPMPWQLLHQFPRLYRYLSNTYQSARSCA
jgi:hypothetical protein